MTPLLARSRGGGEADAWLIAVSFATAGTLIINPPGTQHSVVSEAGCIVLAIYEKPVKFLAPPATTAAGGA